ncbi:hypothetical protein MKW92_000892 [Papaver armeniacum]|nr:hypothetical protein MKW92_000892 [Papaver armeniacum]
MAAVLMVYVLALALLVILVEIPITLSSDHIVYSAANDDQGCSDNLQSLVAQCTNYVMKLVPKIAPSTACCSIVNRIDSGCVCSHVTKRVESLISMDKAVFVANYCGRPLPHGSQCGSYTVPAA